MRYSCRTAVAQQIAHASPLGNKTKDEDKPRYFCVGKKATRSPSLVSVDLLPGPGQTSICVIVVTSEKDQDISSVQGVKGEIMSEILVITCPSGKQCSHLIPLLRDRGTFKLRLAAHSPDSVARLQAKYPAAEVVCSDISSLNDCRELLRGATAVYHVGPSFHSREMEMGFNMIDAAVAESQRPGNHFQHFVFSSVLGTQHRYLLQHDLKCRVEERLSLSPLNFTILQPTNFMDAYPVANLAEQSHPSVEKLWPADNANSLVALRDLAEAAARVLWEREAHYLAQYPLCSTMPVPDSEVVGAIEKHIGKGIEIRNPPFETGVENVLRYLFGDRQSDVYTGDRVERDFRAPAPAGDLRPDLTRDAAERLVLFYSRRGLRGNPNVLRWLIKREPTTVDEWVQRELGRL